MPYVEGFGTYPFGEEWLFDAVIRSYLPLLEFAHDVTITVTPVLADQLEAPGWRSGSARSSANYRLGLAAQRRRELAGRAARRGARPRPSATGAALGVLAALGGDLLGAFAERRARGADSLCWPRPRPTRSCRCWRRAGRRSRSTPACAPTGAASAERGFWLPECAYEPGLEALLARRTGSSWFCVDQSRHEAGGDALDADRDRGGAGRVPDRLADDRRGLVAERLPVRPRATPTSTASR